MVILGLTCVLGAIGLLVAGLSQGDSGLLTASIGASAVGGVAVGIAVMQRGRAADLAGEPAAEMGDADPPAAAPTADPTELTLQAVLAAPPDGSPATESANDRRPDEFDEDGDPLDEPAEEEVEMADVLCVIDLDVEVLVVDLRPRYHLASCEHLRARHTCGIPVNQARSDGFTPCSLCRPDATLATAARRA